MTKEKTNEQGRSMVEMLGVLAVMGVLSVGGVTMYTSAMNKHRANEILNEASKRAVMVASQALMGKTGNIPLSEFASNTFSGVSFGTTAKIENSKIILTLSGDGLADVCGQMIAATGDNAVMKVTKADCTEITFNTDMSRGVASNSDSSSSSGYDENAGAKECSTVADCDAGCQQCSGGKCISKCDVGEYCVQGTSNSDYACKAVTPISCETSSTCPNMAPCCVGNICTGADATCPEGLSWQEYEPGTFGCVDSSGNFVSDGSCEVTSCTNNAECDTPDEYCYVGSSNWSYSEVDFGKCTPVGTANTVDKEEGVSGSAYNGFVYSSERMPWWAADNWCKAQGMRLVSLSDLGITGGYSGGSCRGANCTGADWTALKAALVSVYFWTVDNSNSSDAFYVYTDISEIYDAGRSNHAYALCK